MGAWNHSSCEACWAERNPGREPVRLLVDQEVETCCFCHQPTTAGIYVRSEPMETCQHKEDDG